MSRDIFSDDCADCRPVLIDMATGQAFAADTPPMQRINAVWARTSLQERQTFHRVCCQNSRAPADMRMMRDIANRIQSALSVDDPTESR